MKESSCMGLCSRSHCTDPLKMNKKEGDVVIASEQVISSSLEAELVVASLVPHNVLANEKGNESLKMFIEEKYDKAHSRCGEMGRKKVTDYFVTQCFTRNSCLNLQLRQMGSVARTVGEKRDTSQHIVLKCTRWTHERETLYTS